MQLQRPLAWRKQLERFTKVWLLRQDRHGISAAPPLEYAERFKNRMRDAIEHDASALRRILERSSVSLYSESEEAAPESGWSWGRNS